MKKKIKNKELSDVLIASAQLRDLAVPASLTYALVSSRKKFKEALDIYEQAIIDIGMSRCLKDSNGKPVLEYQADKDGNQLTKLKFETQDLETEALKAIEQLGDEVVEIDVLEFSETIFDKIENVTPLQMEAIITLVNIA